MPNRVLLCIGCRCELTHLAIGNGGLVVVCIACETIGNAREIAEGQKLRPVAPTPRRRVRVVVSSRNR
jgi:hypothetical protein